MLHLFAAALNVSLALTSTPLAADAHDALTSVHRHVRTADARVSAALVEGMRRSPTFARLVFALNRSDVIVYIQAVDRLPATMLGRMVLQTKTRWMSRRYVRIQVVAQIPMDELVAIIGHELQHAMEIADHPEVRDLASLEKLYRRIGAGRSDALGFDTEAAQIAGSQVKKELRGATPVS